MEHWTEYIFYVLVIGSVLIASWKKRRSKVQPYENQPLETSAEEDSVKSREVSWEELMRDLKRQQRIHETVSTDAIDESKVCEPMPKLETESLPIVETTVRQQSETVRDMVCEEKTVTEEQEWRLDTLEKAQQAVVYAEIMQPKY